MKLKLSVCIVSVLAAGCLQPVLGQPTGQTNYFWTAGGDAATWSMAANWRYSWVSNSVTYNGTGAAPASDGTTFQIFIGTGFPTATPTPIVIGPSDNVVLNDQLFGPEWGETLDIYGTVTAGYGFCPLGAVGGPKSTVNLYGTGAYNSGDSIFIGDPWWFGGGPNVDFNLYNSSTIVAKYLIPGGHLNLYDNSTATATIAILAGTPSAGAFGGVSSDLTRWINLAGGTLIMTNGNTAFIQGLIARGIFLCYGKKFDTNEIFIVDNGTNTIVTVTNSLGTLNSVAIDATVTNMMVGTHQTAYEVGNFANMADVPLAYLDAAQSGGGTITYTSSNTNVLSISAAGVVTALSPGTSLVSATYNGSTYGSFSSGSVLFTVVPVSSTLLHRYSFSESSGGTTADSVGGSAWDGTLNGGATLGGGVVTLDGTSGYEYVQLPGGIVSNLDAVTVEAWVNFGSPQAFATLFAFGDQDAAPSPLGMNYICFQPWRGTNDTTAAALFGAGDPGSNDEQDAKVQLVSGGVTNYLGKVHVVCVYHPYAGYVALYTNGILAAINNSVTLPLASTLGADPLNYLGLSLYASDPPLTATIDEFRIYNGPLTAGQIAADDALGPNQLLGTNLNVSLSAALAGNTVALTWSTNSALVNVMSSPTLGPGATWSAVARPVTLSGNNFQMTVPATSSTLFFRLQQ